MAYSFDDVQVGDMLYWESGIEGFGVVKVAKVTVHQFVCSWTRKGGEVQEDYFWKKNGYKVGNDRFSSARVEPLTPARYEQIEIARLKRRAMTLRERLAIPKTKDELEKFIKALTPLVPSALPGVKDEER